MKLVKKSKRKRYYHSETCLAVRKMGRDYFVNLEDKPTIHVEEDRLELCGHCKGVEKGNGDRSYYLKLKELGEANA